MLPLEQIPRSHRNCLSISGTGLHLHNQPTAWEEVGAAQPTPDGTGGWVTRSSGELWEGHLGAKERSYPRVCTKDLHTILKFQLFHRVDS